MLENDDNYNQDITIEELWTQNDIQMIKLLLKALTQKLYLTGYAFVS